MSATLVIELRLTITRRPPSSAAGRFEKRMTPLGRARVLDRRDDADVQLTARHLRVELGRDSGDQLRVEPDDSGVDGSVDGIAIDVRNAA
jgi:hypothetical protein